MIPVTNDSMSIIDILFRALSTYGLPTVIMMMLFLFTMYIIYRVLQKKGMISTAAKCVLFTTVNSKLDTLIQNQRSHLTEDQSRYVLDSLLDTLISKILKKIMQVYIANNIKNNEAIIRENIRSEMKASIRTNDYEIGMISDIERLIKPLSEQLKIVPSCVDLIIKIMLYETDEHDAARKIRSTIETSIKNNWLY